MTCIEMKADECIDENAAAWGAVIDVLIEWTARDRVRASLEHMDPKDQ